MTPSTIASDGTVLYCATDDAEKFNETCVIGTAATFFKNDALGDYRPKAGGPLVKAGENRVDIGAYKSVSPGIVLLFR